MVNDERAEKRRGNKEEIAQRGIDGIESEKVHSVSWSSQPSPTHTGRTQASEKQGEAKAPINERPGIP